jgi:hypothetical protein
MTVIGIPEQLVHPSQGFVFDVTTGRLGEVFPDGVTVSG